MSIKRKVEDFNLYDENFNIDSFIENENKKVRLQNYNEFDFKIDRIQELENNNSDKFDLLLDKINKIDFKVNLISKTFMDFEKRIVDVNNNLNLIENNMITYQQNVNNKLINNQAIFHSLIEKLNNKIIKLSDKIDNLNS